SRLSLVSASLISLLDKPVSARRLPSESRYKYPTSSNGLATLFATPPSRLGSARRSSSRYLAAMVRSVRSSSSGGDPVTSPQQLSASCRALPINQQSHLRMLGSSSRSHKRVTSSKSQASTSRSLWPT